jgi:hypothetical protein
MGVGETLRKKGGWEEEEKRCEVQGLHVNKTLVCRSVVQLLWRSVLLSVIAKG